MAMCEIYYTNNWIFLIGCFDPIAHIYTSEYLHVSFLILQPVNGVIIFTNNPLVIVRFSISSKNICKNNPNYYDAVDLSSFISGKTFLYIFLLSLSWSS